MHLSRCKLIHKLHSVFVNLGTPSVFDDFNVYNTNTYMRTLWNRHVMTNDNGS